MFFFVVVFLCSVLRFSWIVLFLCFLLVFLLLVGKCFYLCSRPRTSHFCPKKKMSAAGWSGGLEPCIDLQGFEAFLWGITESLRHNGLRLQDIIFTQNMLKSTGAVMNSHFVNHWWCGLNRDFSLMCSWNIQPCSNWGLCHESRGCQLLEACVVASRSRMLP